MHPHFSSSLQLMIGLADPFAEISLGAAQAVWERWFSPQRFQRKLAQFEKLGWLDAPARAGNLERIVRLTEKGRVAALGGRDPEACWRRPWDGRWRLALFDVPETQRALRTQLWRKLRARGFGYLQHSVWVSPDSVTAVKEAMQGARLDVETLSFMEARPCGGESDTDIVLGAWDFVRINRGYELYMEILGDQPTRLTGRAWRNWFTVEWRAWCRALRADPLLPEALLPPAYRGREAWRRRMGNLRQWFKTL